MRVTDQLITVAVAGHNEHIVASFFTLARNGGNKVVTLKARHVDGVYTERVEQLANNAQLLSQNIGGCFSLSFIFRNGQMTKGGLGAIKNHNNAIGTMFFQQV